MTAAGAAISVAVVEILVATQAGAISAAVGATSAGAVILAAVEAISVGAAISAAAVVAISDRTLKASPARRTDVRQP